MQFTLALPASSPPWLKSFARSVEDVLRRLDTPPVYTLATVPDATANRGRTIYVSDESGGAVIAFSDGVHWLRSTDRAVIS